MSFRDFKFPDVCKDFGVKLSESRLFPSPPTYVLSKDVILRMEDGLAVSQGLNNEKARSEFVVAPLLLELWADTGRQFGLFSGYELTVDPEKGLNGVCDFMLARDPLIYILSAPLLAIVEAKNDNVWNGYGQCVATMIAASVFNEKAGLLNTTIHGVSTTGKHWKFFRLSGRELIIDADDYTLMPDVSQLAGILLTTAGLDLGSLKHRTTTG